jgi:4-amino-4-deoxy-L-arabinose transferase-like glycosyltransferase
MSVNIKHNLLKHILILGCFVTLYTELLSIFSLINKFTILFGWFLLIFIYRKKIFSIFLYRKYLNLYKKIDHSFETYFILFAIIILFIICMIYPPNNTDALSYRLPKVQQWLQNKNLDIFATPDLRQAMYPSFTEYLILHIKIIFNSDFLINYIQFCSMVLSLVTVSLISTTLGSDEKNIKFTLIFLITLPMFILQSTSSQNDLFLTMWILISVYFFLLYFKHKHLKYVLGFSISLSLAVLTKPTAYIFLFPFCVWYVIETFKEIKNFKIFIQKLFIPLIIFLLINMGFFFRYFEIFFSPIGLNTGTTNDVLNLKIIASNLIRNISLNLTLPSVEFNTFIRNLVNVFHDLIGISLTDLRNTYSIGYGENPPYFIYFSLSENTASNTIHFIIIIIINFTCIIFFKNKRIILSYLFCLLVSFVIFSILLKWQPWGNRLLLPYFVLYAPIISLFNSKILKLISIILIFYSLPFLLMNHTRPLIGSVHREGNKILYNKPAYLKYDKRDLYFIHEINEPYLRENLIIEELNKRSVNL